MSDFVVAGSLDRREALLLRLLLLLFFISVSFFFRFERFLATDFNGGISLCDRGVFIAVWKRLIYTGDHPCEIVVFMRVCGCLENHA